MMAVYILNVTQYFKHLELDHISVNFYIWNRFKEQLDFHEDDYLFYFDGRWVLFFLFKLIFEIHIGDNIILMVKKIKYYFTTLYFKQAVSPGLVAC